LNAGTWQGAPIQDTSEAQWDQLLDLNLKGSFLALKHAIPHLVAAARAAPVVGIGSIGGWVGQANSAAYAASKWGTARDCSSRRRTSCGRTAFE
jgi:NADP-dependent 3-hydroxy acid dehydrogenase YdfG